jgi:hypothetical protein
MSTFRSLVKREFFDIHALHRLISSSLRQVEWKLVIIWRSSASVFSFYSQFHETMGQISHHESNLTVRTPQMTDEGRFLMALNLKLSRILTDVFRLHARSSHDCTRTIARAFASQAARVISTLAQCLYDDFELSKFCCDYWPSSSLSMQSNACAIIIHRPKMRQRLAAKKVAWSWRTSSIYRLLIARTHQGL